MTCKKTVGLDGLFLLFEGFPATVFESQVLTHVRTMTEVGVRMEVWSFATTGSAYHKGRAQLSRLEKDHQVKIRLLRGMRLSLPFSRQFNALLLLWHMRNRVDWPKFVHARTDYAASVAATAKAYGGRWRLIWDARGDTLAEHEDRVVYRKGLYHWWALVRSHVIRRGLRYSAKTCDGAIFVSEALRLRQGSTVEVGRTLVVPCLADEKHFYFDPSLRQEIRRSLGYSDDHRVVLYSGSAAPWQCVPETVDRMVKTLALSPHYRALIVTSEPEVFEQLVPASMKERITIRTGTLKEMNGVLNAADVGIMLRASSPINWAASPVKFAEYCLTGLQVFMNRSVQQSVEFAEQFGNILSDEIGEVNLDPSERARIAQAAQKLVGRSSFIPVLRSFYKRICVGSSCASSGDLP